MIKVLTGKAKRVMGKDLFSFLTHSKNYISASFFGQGLSVLTVPIFTRILVPADYGILAIMNSFVAVFAVVAGLGVRSSVTRYYYEGKNDFGEFLGSAFVLISMWTIFLSVALVLGSGYLGKVFNVPHEVLYLAIGIVFFQAIFQLYESYLRATKKSGLIANITMFEKLVTIALSVIIMLSLEQNRFLGKAWSMLTIKVAIGGYSLVLALRVVKVNLNMEHVKYALVFSFPVMLHLLSQYILSAFDRVIINQLVGSAEAGLYSLAYTVGAFQSMITNGMLKAWTPEFYTKLNAKKYDDINRLASKCARAIYLSAFGIILFAREILIVLASEKYHGGLKIVPVIVVAYIFFFLYSMYVNFSFYQKKTHLIAPVTIVAGLVNIGMNYWLIPIYGYEAAAWTTLVSYAVLFILHYCNVRYIVKPEWITGLSVLLPGFFMLLVGVMVFGILQIAITNTQMLFVGKILIFHVLAFAYFGKALIMKWIN